MSQYWSAVVRGLTPYVPGEQPKIDKLIKLNTNENPYPPSPHVLQAIRAELGEDAARLRLYPDPNADVLKACIARLHGLNANQVFVGNGSDEVLALVFQALLKHDAPTCFPDVTYSFYPVYCGLYEINFRTVPLTEDFSIRPEDYTAPCGGIIIANPNAPTAKALSLGEVERLTAAHPECAVVVDEAYIEFGGEPAIPLIDAYPNLLIVRTLSKSHALAGARVGYALGNAALIEGLERVKNSFNSYPLDRLAQIGAIAALQDTAYFEQTRRAIIKSREKLVADLAALGLEVLPSAANFVFARHPQRDGAELAQQLRERAILVRHFKLPRIDQFLRISIGTDAECAALVSAFREILA
ncbi:MAG: Histidinol-phosphate aminotransferase [Betaproteobacteria bacterium ADurb.Bin341]|nr:MAG: Histidinol-phosphate aminotransferase [Betaproteobacteria bacterium ADurb.Bin341]